MKALRINRHARASGSLPAFAAGLLLTGALALGSVAGLLPSAGAVPEAVAVECAGSVWPEASDCYEDGAPVLDVCTEPSHALYLLLRYVWLLSDGLAPASMWSMLGGFAEHCTEPAG